MQASKYLYIPYIVIGLREMDFMFFTCLMLFNRQNIAGYEVSYYNFSTHKTSSNFTID